MTGKEIIPIARSLTIREWDNIDTIDIEPPLSMAELLALDKPYETSRKSRNGLNLKQNDDFAFGTCWPESHIVRIDDDKTTLGFTIDSLAIMDRDTMGIAKRLADLIAGHVEIKA